MNEKNKIKLITYGNGERFDISKFKPIKNSWKKPNGGLWASPVDSSFGWKDWCELEEFGDLSHSFEFEIEGSIFKIDSFYDLEKMDWFDAGFDTHDIEKDGSMKWRHIEILYPDFEKILSIGYDAIWLTERGQAETRLYRPQNLYGWDCESVLIMNPDCVLQSELLHEF